MNLQSTLRQRNREHRFLAGSKEDSSMELAGMTMYKTLVMTILALVGVFCYHKKIVDQEMNKKLSELVLSLFTPVLLFTSFQKDFSKELVTGLMYRFCYQLLLFF